MLMKRYSRLYRTHMVCGLCGVYYSEEAAMRLRVYIPDRDFDVIKNWITDERTHAMWCANRTEYPIREESFRDFLRDIGLRNGDCPYIATEDDGTVCGFFCYSLNPETNTGMLKFVMVDPEKRGRGLGKIMLRLAVQFAFEITKADAVKLAVFLENERALKCYEGVGFTEIKTDAGAFRFRDELWGRRSMMIRKEQFGGA